MSSRDKSGMGLKIIYTQLLGYYIKTSSDIRYVYSTLRSE